MTTDIALTLGILGVALLLLAFERLRTDLVALLVLLALALSGLVTPREALSGFSNPSVVTVWAMFILGVGLARTGVAHVLGRNILRISGRNSESGLIAAIMLLAAALSAFMNSSAIVAMFLPVISFVARKGGFPPSRLLMPLAFATLLGGVNTLISTLPNILVNNALEEFAGQSFRFFDFALAGLPVSLAGIAFMVLFGRHLLPKRDLAAEMQRMGRDPEALFGLEERLFVLKLPPGSPFAGKRLAESRLGRALKLNVVGIQRKGVTQPAPNSQTLLREGDELLVLGKSDWLEDLLAGQKLILENGRRKTHEQLKLDVKNLVSKQVSLMEVVLRPDSALIGQSLYQIDFRKKYNANVLAIWRERSVRTNFQDIPLRESDRLLVQASRKQLEELSSSTDFLPGDPDAVTRYGLEERLLLLAVPAGSTLDGKNLAQSELADAFGLSVLGIIRGGKTRLMPRPRERLRAGDQLVVEGKLEDVELLQAIQQLQVQEGRPPRMSDLENEQIGLVEVVVSPYSRLDGKTLRDIKFREKYDLNVLAIWRGGRAYRSNLRQMALHHGDSLLVYGDRTRIKLLSEEQDFLVLAQELQEAPKREKALISVAIMAGVVAAAGLRLLEIEIAALTGAAAMVLTGCLSMEEAQRSIRWQAIFLIAGMLPLGIALQNSGAAAYLGQWVLAQVGGWAPPLFLAALFLFSNLLAQVVPPPVVAVLVSSVVLGGGFTGQASPQALLITIALGSAMPFLSPISHPANLLVMGPGGYRFSDYTKVGLPLTLLAMLVAVVAVPFFWPAR
ncbi:MAG: SLC13 family permease [Anaerolineales bacterium]|nr:SLC13 family permease [Anaerolineales bacterium]